MSARERGLSPRLLGVQWLGAELPILSVTAVIAVGAALVWLDHWRKGAMLLGFAVLLGALWRIVLSPERVGLLRVRGRRFDITAMCVVGATMVWLAWSINPHGTGGA